jgi:golgin subfamily A member 4
VDDINKALFDYLFRKYSQSLNMSEKVLQVDLQDLLSKSNMRRQLNLNSLRPNLKHPDNKSKLDLVNESEARRRDETAKDVKRVSMDMIRLHFAGSNELFVVSLNYLYFMIEFYDAWVLREDYTKLPGDEDVQKHHLNLKKLMILKEKGELTNTASERAIKKSWKPFPVDTFKYKDMDPGLVVVEDGA